MKLKAVKFANSIPVGGVQNYFYSHPDYEIELENSVLIRIKDARRGHKQISSIFNAIHFEEFDEEPKAAKSTLVKADKK